MCTGQKTTRIGHYAVFGAPERILIQRFIGLSNIKFSELRIEKMKENCNIIEMRVKTIPVKETAHETLVPVPAPVIRIQYGNSVKIQTGRFII